jgi:bifunctional non-homologous end joining protein LigD
VKTSAKATPSPKAAPAKKRPKQRRHSGPGKGKVRITHPDRVIDAVSGTTKMQLAEYYASVAEWILPQLKDRPVALVRAPDGIAGELFFQKNAERLAIPASPRWTRRSPVSR